MTGSESSRKLNSLFTFPQYQSANKAANGTLAGVPTLGRNPPIQAETNWQNRSNPHSHMRLDWRVTNRGSDRASLVMGMSMKPVFNGAADQAKRKPAYTNSNAAPPWLLTYGPSSTSGNRSPPETSIFAIGGGGPTLLRNKNRTNYTTLKMG